MRTAPSARFYELMAISVPDGTPEELVETSEAVSGYVTSAGGTILRSSNDSPWGRRRLAYPIRHNSADLRDGFYTLYYFQIQPDRIEDIERELRLNERIIRHLLLQLDSEPVFAEPEEEGEGAGESEMVEAIAVDEAVAVAEEAAEEAAVADEAPVVAQEVQESVEPVTDDTEVVEAKEE